MKGVNRQDATEHSNAKLWYYEVDVYNLIAGDWVNVATKIKRESDAIEILDKFMESEYATMGEVTLIEKTTIERIVPMGD